MCIYIYIYREREIDKERDIYRERERERDYLLSWGGDAQQDDHLEDVGEDGIIP